MCVSGRSAKRPRAFRTRAIENKRALKFLYENWDEMVSSGSIDGMVADIKDTPGSPHGLRMRKKIMQYFAANLNFTDDSHGFSESELSDALCKNWESRRRSFKETATKRLSRKLKARYADRPNTTFAVYLSSALFFPSLFIVCAVFPFFFIIVCAVYSSSALCKRYNSLHFWLDLRCSVFLCTCSHQTIICMQ